MPTADNLFFNVEDKLREAIRSACMGLGKNLNSNPDLSALDKEISLVHPVNIDFGDYSTNIAMYLASRYKSNPMTIGQKIKDELVKNTELETIIDSVEIAPPGYINIRLKNEFLLDSTKIILDTKKFKEGLAKSRPGKKVLLEHTSPNTNKSLHIGHLRNNLLGTSLVRLLRIAGNTVVADCLYNDRGVHISKAMWGYLKNDQFNKPWKDLIGYWQTHQDEWPSPESLKLKPDHFVEKFYGIGVKLEDKDAYKKEMQEMLLAWESGDRAIRELWEKLNNWVYEGFAQTYEAIGSFHDNNWYESDFYQKAKETVEVGLEKGVFRKLNDGAVLTNLASFNLTDNIVQRSDGTSMYFTQDVFLTKQKIKKFPSDLYIWVVGPEQQLHLQQVFAVCEQLGISKRDKLIHLWYGYVFLKNQGKMSSRKGTVVSIDSLVEESTRRALDLVEKNMDKKKLAEKIDKNDIAKKVGLAAIKYAILKIDKHQDIHFDWNEALDIKGNCGPYIQYTCTRCFSVLSKKKYDPSSPVETDNPMTKEEEELLRSLCRMPETIITASDSLAPHIIAQYLFEVSQKYNTFYEKCKVIGSKNERLRLFLTAITSKVLEFGLEILGIEAVERM